MSVEGDACPFLLLITTVWTSAMEEMTVPALTTIFMVLVESTIVVQSVYESWKCLLIVVAMQ